MLFQNRRDAGRQLGAALADRNPANPVVLALPRGGVPVGFEVARALNAPLDTVIVRKIGAPFHPELGVGALAEDGVPRLDEASLRMLGLTVQDLQPTIAAERAELARRIRRYRGDRPPPDVEGCTAIVVDDGLATGGSAQAALEWLRTRGPAQLMLAVPVCAPDSLERFEQSADEVVCLLAPRAFTGVGAYYRDFTQTSDEEVLDLLRQARQGVGR